MPSAPSPERVQYAPWIDTSSRDQTYTKRIAHTCGRPAHQHAAELMPQDHVGRIVDMPPQSMLGPWIFARPVSQVTATDTTGLDLNQHVLRLC